jgi:hypothetical protein
MGEKCSMHWEVRNMYKSWSERLKERDHSENLGLDGTILELISGK